MQEHKRLDHDKAVDTLVADLMHYFKSLGATDKAIRSFVEKNIGPAIKIFIRSQQLTEEENALLGIIREVGWGEIEKIKFQNGQPTTVETKKITKLK